MGVTLALETVFGLPRSWLGLAVGIAGVLFWIAGFAILNWIFERYLKDIDAPPEE